MNIYIYRFIYIYTYYVLNIHIFVPFLAAFKFRKNPASIPIPIQVRRYFGTSAIAIANGTARTLSSVGDREVAKTLSMQISYAPFSRWSLLCDGVCPSWPQLLRTQFAPIATVFCSCGSLLRSASEMLKLAGFTVRAMTSKMSPGHVGTWKRLKKHRKNSFIISFPLGILDLFQDCFFHTPICPSASIRYELMRRLQHRVVQEFQEPLSTVLIFFVSVVSGIPLPDTNNGH